MISPYDAFLSAWRDCERYSRASRRSEACADSARSRVVSHMHIGWQAHAGVMRGLMRGLMRRLMRRLMWVRSNPHES